MPNIALLAPRPLSRSPVTSVRNSGGGMAPKGGHRSPLGGRLPTHIRVSVGAPPEDRRFIEALRAKGCRMMGGHMRFPRSCGRIFP